MKVSKSFIYYLFPLSFFGFICWIIYMANTGVNSIFFLLVESIPYGDKLGHLFLYGILAMLFNLALKCRTITIYKIPLQLGGLIVFSFAFIEELSQYFFPNRTLDYTDLLADICGIIIFNYFSRIISRKNLA